MLSDEERIERRRESKRRYNRKHREKANAMRRAWAAENPGYIAERRRRHREQLDELKRERGCLDCGTRSGELHFDHRPGEIKLFDVAHAKNRSWKTIMVEVDKCDVRCAGCHARRHIKAGDTFRDHTNRGVWAL